MIESSPLGMRALLASLHMLYDLISLDFFSSFFYQEEKFESRRHSIKQKRKSGRNPILREAVKRAQLRRVMENSKVADA